MFKGKKRLAARMLSIVLAAGMSVSGVSVGALAAEISDASTEQETVVEQAAAEEQEVVPEAEDEQEEIAEAETEEPAEPEAEVVSEDPETVEEVSAEPAKAMTSVLTSARTDFGSDSTRERLSSPTKE